MIAVHALTVPAAKYIEQEVKRCSLGNAKMLLRFNKFAEAVAENIVYKEDRNQTELT